MNKSINTLVLVVIISFSVPSAVLASGGFDLFGSFGFKSKEGRNKEAVTRINSKSLDVKYQDNTIVFKGDVVLNDQDLVIECDKMIVKLVDDATQKAGKTPKFIECIGNFVATRKIQDPKEKKQGQQRAVAGKAILEIETGKITMFESPCISRGQEALKGSKITIWMNNEKLVAENAQIETLGENIMGE